jgi:hypothetical protein
MWSEEERVRKSGFAGKKRKLDNQNISHKPINPQLTPHTTSVPVLLSDGGEVRGREREEKGQITPPALHPPVTHPEHSASHRLDAEPDFCPLGIAAFGAARSENFSQ